MGILFPDNRQRVYEEERLRQEIRKELEARQDKKTAYGCVIGLIACVIACALIDDN